MVDNPPGAPEGGTLGKKLWGLPTWGWIAIAAAGGIAAVVYLQYRKKGAAASTASDTSTSADSTGGTNGSYDSDYDQELLATIRDLQGSTSTATTSSTATSTLAAPTNLKFTSVTPTHAFITWSAVTGATKYHVVWQSKQGTVTNVPLAPINDHNYKLAKGDTLTVRVSAVDSNNLEGPGTTIYTTIK
jgi:hypothetical protein